MIKVTPLRDCTTEHFSQLFENYYKELGCGDDAKHLVDEYILPDLTAGLIRCDLLEEGEECAGFVIYQIDDIDNEWNLKEGWGNVREIYIAPPFRRKGYGKFLLYAAELKLRESGATRSYCLPYEYAAPFFKACGYTETDEYNDELDCCVYVKESLVNRCRKERK